MNDGLSTVLESGVCAVLRKLPPEKWNRLRMPSSLVVLKVLR